MDDLNQGSPDQNVPRTGRGWTDQLKKSNWPQLTLRDRLPDEDGRMTWRSRPNATKKRPRYLDTKILDNGFVEKCQENPAFWLARIHSMTHQFW